MSVTTQHVLGGNRPRDVLRRSTIVAVVSFLTLIDLFGTQALLPQIITRFATNSGTAGLAVNAATAGMAASGLAVAWFADRIDRKRGLWLCLALLSIPTALLAMAGSIWMLMALRVVQGIFMAAAFTLTMTYLSEQCDVMARGGALAAYITGNVAANLLGRLLAVSLTEATSLAGCFLIFALLNLCGALLCYAVIGARDAQSPTPGGRPLDAWRRHLAAPPLRAAFAIGFLILFVFVGVFTYVNLHLVGTLGVPPTALGLVYLVFTPALITTPLANRLVVRLGPRAALILSLAGALAGLALTVVPFVPLVLLGMAVIGLSTFAAQAAAAGYVSAHVVADRAQANGLYLASYYLGGLTGAFLLGQINVRLGWPATAAALAASLTAAILIARRLKD